MPMTLSVVRHLAAADAAAPLRQNQASAAAVRQVAGTVRADGHLVWRRRAHPWKTS